MGKIRTANSLTCEQVRILFDYNEATGVLLWKNRHGRCTTGSKAGCVYGYQRTLYRVNIDQITYDVPAIIWLWKTGEHAPRQILHANGDCLDNSWTNLVLLAEPEHGSGSRAHWRPFCQCDLCKECRRTRKKIQRSEGSTQEHGTYHKYESGCRCEACRGANADHHRNYRARKGTEWVKNVNLKSVFGITLSEYNEMRLRQNSCCAICGESENLKTHKGLHYQLVVDHNHKTRKIRGLLCSACNRALGLLKDNVEVLQNACEYLKKHETKTTKE